MVTHRILDTASRSAEKRSPIGDADDSDASFRTLMQAGPVDALNVWDLFIQWKANPQASIVFRGSLPVVPFDSIFPCGVVPGSLPPSARDCLPEPGVTDGSRFLDILSYRQRPTWRLAYRNFKDYEALVTNQSVEAAPGVAGVRWYEIRRTGDTYSVYQQGSYAPGDCVHRWLGRVAMG